MTRYLCVIGGKGGTGKTTTSINLGAALNSFGKDVTVVDGNLTTPNVGVHLGVPIVPISLHDVLQGKNHISEAVYQHPSGTKIVPASLSVSDLKKTNPTTLKRALKGLYGTTDFVILDSAAGLGKEALLAIDASDEILIITNPELPAITDALKTIKMSEELGKRVAGVIVAKTRGKGDLSLKNIESILEKPIISVIPDDNSVREALNLKDAVVLTHPKSDVAISYKKLAANLLGQEYNEEVEKIKRGLFSRFFDRFKR